MLKHLFLHTYSFLMLSYKYIICIFHDCVDGYVGAVYYCRKLLIYKEYVNKQDKRYKC